MTAPPTLLLSRRTIAGLMDQADWLEAVETGFRASAQGRAKSPPPMSIDGDGGAFHAKGASLELDRLYMALKLNGNFPDNPAARGLPTIQGALLLCDGHCGSLLAVMDSIEITLRRTAAATALAARHLARPESEIILICGCGEQGAAHLATLRHVLPLKRAYAWDRDTGKTAAFARAARGDGFDIEAVAELETAARQSDVIVTCTTARSPFLMSEFVRPGTFVAAVGADSPDKSEIDPELLARCRLVADVADQCVVMGDTHHAISAGIIDRTAIVAEMAQIVVGSRQGRGSPDDIVVYDSTGSALQDVASAAVIYCRALASDRPPSIEFGTAA